MNKTGDDTQDTQKLASDFSSITKRAIFVKSRFANILSSRVFRKIVQKISEALRFTIKAGQRLLAEIRMFGWV